MSAIAACSRLRGRKAIEQLFIGGRSLNVPPLRVVFTTVPFMDQQHKATVFASMSVSKKKFRKAVDRNLIRRRMREAFRRNNAALAGFYSNQRKYLYMMIQFTGNEKTPYTQIEKTMIELIERLTRQ